MSEAAAVERSFDSTSIRRWPHGRGTSLSEGGMVLFVGAEFRPGDQVAVEFTLPFSSPPIRVEAKTFNRTGYHYGVEFLAIDNSQRQSVDQLRMHLASFAIGD
jgi:hypothetical protein